MGLYDDGGVDFAEKKFADAQEYKNKQAKKQDDFSKTLLGVDTLFRGVASLAKSKGEALQDKNIPQRAYLQNFLTRQNNIRSTIENNMLKNGQVDAGSLQSYIYDQLSSDFAEGAFGHLDPDTYAAVLDKHAKSEAERLLPSYQKMYEESLDVPDLETSLEQFDKYNAMQNPTDVFSMIKKGSKRILGIEDEETINWQNTQQRDVLRNTPLGNEFYQYQEAVNNYEKQIGADPFGMDSLLVKLNRGIQDGSIKGKIIGTPSIEEVVKTSGNVTTKEKVAMGYMRNPNTGLVEWVPINGGGTVRVKSTEIKNIEPPSANMISQAENLIKTSLQNTNPKLWQAISNGKMTTKDRGYNVEYYANKVAYAVQSIENMPGAASMSYDDKQQIAFEWVAHQMNRGWEIKQAGGKEEEYEGLLYNPETNVTAYRISGMNAEKNNNNWVPHLENTDVWVSEIIKNVGTSPSQLNSEINQLKHKTWSQLQVITRQEDGTAKNILPDAVANADLEGSVEEQIYQYEVLQMEKYNTLFNPHLSDVNKERSVFGPEHQQYINTVNVPQPVSTDEVVPTEETVPTEEVVPTEETNDTPINVPGRIINYTSGDPLPNNGELHTGERVGANARNQGGTVVFTEQEKADNEYIKSETKRLKTLNKEQRRIVQKSRKGTFVLGSRNLNKVRNNELLSSYTPFSNWLRKETNNEVRIQDLRTDESLRKQYQEQFAKDIYNDLLTVEGIDEGWLNQMFDMDFNNEELMIADAE